MLLQWHLAGLCYALHEPLIQRSDSSLLHSAPVTGAAVINVSLGLRVRKGWGFLAWSSVKLSLSWKAVNSTTKIKGRHRWYGRRGGGMTLALKTSQQQSQKLQVPVCPVLSFTKLGGEGFFCRVPVCMQLWELLRLDGQPGLYSCLCPCSTDELN